MAGSQIWTWEGLLAFGLLEGGCAFLVVFVGEMEDLGLVLFL